MHDLGEPSDDAAGRPVAQDDPRVIEALEQYIAAREAGRKPDRQEFLARHPEVADALAKCLDGLDFVHAAAPQLAQASANVLPALDSACSLGGPIALGDYRIIREIGRGGMGVVYEAQQMSLGRRVALKVLPFAAVMDQRQLQRFKNEAMAAAHLDHQNIVHIHSVGCERGVHFYAMQFIEGRTLAEVVRELRGAAGRESLNPGAPGSGGMSTSPIAALSTKRSTNAREYFRTIARLGVQAAEALDHAHKMGVLHRDIKPSNLLLEVRGNLWITDFGLAQFQNDASLTRTGDLIGTLRYMSPEQATGRAVLDQRTDIYSLGASLYELLALAPPFECEDRYELLRQIADVEPRLLRRVNSAIPRDLETIVQKAMAKEAASRYPSASELAQDLNRFLDEKLILAKPPTLLDRSAKWARRHQPLVRLGIVLLAFSTLSLAVSTALVWHARIEADRQRKAAEEQRLIAVEQRMLAVERERITRQNLYAAHVRLAWEAWKLGDRRRATELLAQHAASPGQEDRPGFEWHYLWRLAHLESRVLLGHAGHVYHVTFSPDGQTLATTSQDRTVKLWDISSERVVVTLSGHSGEVNWVAFSPDGKRLATASDDHTIRLWDAATGREQTSRVAHSDCVVCVVFSPDGKLLASGGHDNLVRLWNADTGELVADLTGHIARIQSLAFAPTGDLLASASSDRTVRIWDVPAARERMVLDNRRPALAVAFSHDGQTIATGGIDGTIHLWSTRAGEELNALYGHAGSVDSLVFSLDDRTLASGGGDELLRFWDVASGRPKNSVPGHSDRIWCVAASPRGDVMATASADHTVRLWELGAAQGRKNLIALAGDVTSLAFDPDGRLLACGLLNGASQGVVRIWDPVTGERIADHRDGSGQPSTHAALSADAQEIAWALDAPFVSVRDVDPSRDRTSVTAGPPGVPGGVGIMTFAPDRKTLAMICSHGEFGPWSEVFLLDVQRCQIKATLPKHGGPVSLAFSPDGTLLATGSLGDVKLWDAVTGQLRSCLGRYTGADKNGLYCVGFAPDGKMIGGGSPDSQIKLWNVETGRERAILLGHTGAVLCLAFSPDGKTLATGSADQTVKLWSMTTGQELLTLVGHSAPVGLLKFSPDGMRLVSAARSADAEIFLWDAAPAVAQNLERPNSARTTDN